MGYLQPITGDVLRYVCQLLRDEGDYKTLAAVQQASRSSYLITTTILYDKVTITTINARNFYEALINSPLSYTQDDFRQHDNADEQHPIDMSIPARVSHCFAQTRILTVDYLDPIAAEAIRDRHPNILGELGSTEAPFCPRLERNSLGAEVVGAVFNLAGFSDLLKRIFTTSTLRHVCLHYPRPTWLKYLPIHEPSLASPRKFLKHDNWLRMDTLLQEVKHPEPSLTCHDIAIHPIPFLRHNHTRVLASLHAEREIGEDMVTAVGGTGERRMIPAGEVRSRSWQIQQIAIPLAQLVRLDVVMDQWTIIHPWSTALHGNGREDTIARRREKHLRSLTTAYTKENLKEEDPLLDYGSRIEEYTTPDKLRLFTKEEGYSMTCVVCGDHLSSQDAQGNARLLSVDTTPHGEAEPEL